MSKLVSCFQCGFDYVAKSADSCPKCGEIKIFVPALHDPNYDMMRDPVFLGKYRIRIAVILFLVFTLTFTVILK